MAISIRHAELTDRRDAEAVARLLASYAADPQAGWGVAIAEEAERRLPESLDAVPGRVVLLAEDDGRAVGLAICFPGFSTFAARPLLNLHDLVVDPDCRGQGVGGKLLEAVDDEARRGGCVAVTLEVLGANHGAQRLYRRHGFVGGEQIEPPSAPMFFKKTL
ncbi:MAG: GNAT family N-acetyltransferase [Planctomycetota bacterium]